MSRNYLGSIQRWQELRELARTDPQASLASSQSWVAEAAGSDDCSETVYSYSALAHAQHRSCDTEAAIESLRQTVVVDNRQIETEAMACRDLVLSHVCLTYVDLTLALCYARRAFVRATRGRDARLVLQCLSVIGCVESNLPAHTSRRALNMLLERCDGAEDDPFRMVALGNLAHLKFASRHHASGRKYALQALAIAERLDDRMSIVSSLSAYALNCAGEGNIDTAEAALSQSIAVAHHPATALYRSVELFNLGQIYAAGGARTQAVCLWESALVAAVGANQWALAKGAMRALERTTTMAREPSRIPPELRSLVTDNLARRLPRAMSAFGTR